MTSLQKRKLAELSLIFAMPIFTGANDNSRLAGLQKKMQKLVQPDLASLTNVTASEVHAIDNLIEAWFKDIGWWKNSKSIGALVSFCLDMIEGSPIKYNHKIMANLNLLADHLEKGEELEYPSLKEASAIANYWQVIYA